MENEFDKLRPRVKYYLLDFKDANMELVQKQFGTSRLKDLSRFNLKILFRMAYENDKNF